MSLRTQTLSLTRLGTKSLAFEDFFLTRGESVLLKGPSGSGKTTLLSMIAGLLTPTSGKVFLQDQDLYAMPTLQRDALRGKTYGFIFQTLHLFPALSVEDNIHLAAKVAYKPVDTQYIQSLLISLGLASKAHSKPHELSQGERQRAAIARAVINRPDIIVADEPTSALDDANAKITIDLIREQVERSGAAFLLATHDARITDGFDKVLDLGKNLRNAA